MADNVPVTPGSGETVATNLISGVHYQRTKMVVGAPGTATDLAPGQAAMAASIPVALASDQPKPWAASVAGSVSAFTSVSSATLQASNGSRKGLTIFNEGAGILYVLLGSGTASATNYTLQMKTGDYYEVPFGYTGQVNAIFGAAGTARVQEMT